MQRLMNNNQIANLISSGIETKGLDLLNNTTVVGEMLRPSTENIVLSNDMLDRIVEYKLFGEEPEGSIVINVKMNKFRKCRIGSKIFGSSMLSQHVNSSFILAKFVTSDGEVNCYPG
ncbi:hypothetical protein RhiirC2_792881 [Rhizophagus irregularis]|uniref:Uncharacterized protein n=1 Tax=Rhizophagus irregularis TaxID=588596 RepID=A0A2N1MGI0_9GLOM|nr:hypothetical protein RhiirC2_792881 [Rhizophagus irregularis]